MKKCLSFLLLNIFLFSCAKEKEICFFTDNMVVVDRFDKEKDLSGHLFIADQYGTNSLLSSEDYLITFSHASIIQDNIIKIFNTQGDSVCFWGRKGQGPEDFISVSYDGQFEENDSILNFYLEESALNQLRQIKINKNKHPVNYQTKNVIEYQKQEYPNYSFLSTIAACCG